MDEMTNDILASYVSQTSLLYDYKVMIVPFLVDNLKIKLLSIQTVQENALDVLPLAATSLYATSSCTINVLFLLHFEASSTKSDECFGSFSAEKEQY